MANEITINLSMQVAKGNFSTSFAPGALQFDQTAIGAHMPIVDVGTTEETLSLGDVSTEGWIVMRNLDSSNYIQLGFSTGVYGIRMEAGEVACFRMNPGLTIYAKANTSACKLQVIALED